MAVVKGKNALMEILLQEGVQYVFGIPGATEIPFMDAIENTPTIQYVLGLNEIVCAGMAEGYARASGRPGFLNLHTGTGVAASLPMLYNAMAGGVPLVITAGQQDTRLLQYEPHLSGDIVGMGKLYTKWAAEVVHAKDIPAVMQRAFKMAIQPPAGPVLVSLPLNTLEESFEYTKRPNTKVYAALRPDREALKRALEILLEAERPLLFVESGVTRCNALEEVVRFAELIGARVYQGWMSDVNFPVSHPLYLGDMEPTGPQARRLFQEADLLIGIGSPMFDQGFYVPEIPLPENLRTIQIDENPWEIGKNMPVDCGIHGDIRESLREINAAMEKNMDPRAREDAAKRMKLISDEKSQMNAGLKKLIEEEKENVPIAVSRLMMEIGNCISDETLVVDDCWSSSGMLRSVLDLSNAGRFFRARRGGSIGWGLPGALGVKLGAPDKPVIAVSGDGSAAWSMQSFWTAARYRIPVTFVITNNATYRQVKLVRKRLLGDYPLDEKHVGMELDEPVMDFCLLARSMGVPGTKVAEPAELAPALKGALESGGPHVVEVLVENKP